MSMETDIRAKKNEAKLNHLCEWGTPNSANENVPKISMKELLAKVEAMSGPQETGDFSELVEHVVDIEKSLKKHNEILVLMAEALEKFEEKLKKPSMKRTRKYNTKRKRAA